MTVDAAGDARSLGRSAASWLPAVILLVGSSVVALGSLAPVVASFDGSALGRAGVATWMVLLPAAVALTVSFRNTLAGAAVTAGAGILGGTRLLSDAPLVSGPSNLARPELFYEISDGAQPLRATGGGLLMLFGDLLIGAAGMLACRRLGNTFDLATSPDWHQDGQDSAVTQGEDGPNIRKGSRNNLLIAAGFLGVVGLLAASLGVPYSGGYLDLRFLPVGLDLWGIGAALAAASVAAAAVLVAAGASRAGSVGLLTGIAAAGAAPFLTAAAAVATGAPVTLGPSAGVGIAAALVIAVAGLITKTRPDERAEDLDDGESGPAGRRLMVTGVVLLLITAGGAAAAWKLPELRYNGGPDPLLPSGFAISAPLAAPFGPVFLLALAAGVLWAIPVVADAGRALAALSWAGCLFALAQSLHLFGSVVGSAGAPNAGFAAPSWSVGPGLWAAIIAAVLSVAGAAIALADGRRVTDASLEIVDDDSLVAPRAFGTVVATVLTALSLASSALPVYRTDNGPGPTVRIGFELDSWGVLALTVGTVCAAWAAGRARNGRLSVGFAVGGAALVATRLVVPASVRGAPGFLTGAGWYAALATVFAFLVAAGVLAVSARQIRSGLPTPIRGRAVPIGGNGRKTAPGASVPGATVPVTSSAKATLRRPGG